MKKPIIGVTPAISPNDAATIMIYNGMLDALWKAGGLPVLLPLTREPEQLAALLDEVDGLLFSGGGDVDPLLYGECQHLNIGKVTPERDHMELPLARMAAERTDVAVFGICRGFQVLNIALGGTVWQDIPSEYPDHPILHRQQSPSTFPSHEVTVTPGSRLYGMIGAEKTPVNSHHHQAVRVPGKGMTVTACAPDGIIEASELTDHPFYVGVQWHPERLWTTDPASMRLFEGFVKAADSLSQLR